MRLSARTGMISQTVLTMTLSEALEEGGAQVFTTGDGVVQAVSDGTNLSVRQ